MKRSCKLVWFAAVAILLGTTLVGTPARAAENQIEVLDSNLMAVPSLDLSIAAGANSATKVLYLRATQDMNDPISAVRVNLELDIGTATFTGPNGVSLGDSITIPPHKGIAEIHLSVTVPADKEAKGALIAIAGSKAEKLGPVKVTAASAPKVAIAENHDGISRTATTTDYTLFLTLTADAGGAKGVNVTVPDLTDPSGVQVPVTAALDGMGGPIDLGPLATARLAITTQIATAGDYTGSIVVDHDGKREVGVPLTIKRTQVKPTVEVLALQRVASSTSHDVVLEALIQETSGRPVRLDRPHLIALGRKKGDERTGPSFKDADVTIERIDLVTGRPRSVEQNIDLAGGEATTIRFTIRNVGGPGEYGARLRLTAPSAESLTSDTAIILKDPSWMALGAILLGVVLVLVYRLVLRPRQARAPQQIDVNHLRQDFLALQSRYPDDDADTAVVLNVLYSELQELRDAADGGESFGAARDRLNVKMSLADAWLLSRRRIRTLEAGAPVQLLIADLNSILPKLLSESAAKEDLTAALSAVTALGTKVDGELRTQVLAHITELRQQADAAAATTSFVVGDDAKTRIKTDVIPELDKAKASLDGQTDAGRQAFDALQHLEAATHAFAEVLIGDLSSVVAGDAPVPGVDWNGLRSQVQGILLTPADTAAELLGVYGKAFSTYVLTIAAAARALATEAKRKFALVQPQPANAADILDLYQHAVDQAALVPGLLAVNDRAAAFKAYEQARDDKKRADGLSAPPGVAAAPGPEVPTPPMQPPDAVGPALRSSAAAAASNSRPIAPFTNPRPAARHAEWWTALVSAILAAILGLALLWANNDTWGGPYDLGLAVAWGAGLHEIAGQTVTGVGGVLKKLADA